MKGQFLLSVPWWHLGAELGKPLELAVLEEHRPQVGLGVSQRPCVREQSSEQGVCCWDPLEEQRLLAHPRAALGALGPYGKGGRDTRARGACQEKGEPAA